ncbi:MAG: DNA-binding PadR family transcriptional regulator [Candidatus Nanohaloarchaea archaeon]|jgi:DNA-binding PadR family transcriptional regulator
MSTERDESSYSVDLNLLDHGNKDLIVLTSIAEIQEEKGYASGIDVEEFLEERFNKNWSSGKLYPILHDLNDDGYLNLKENTSTKDYTLTEEGFERLGDEIDNLLETAYVLGQTYDDIGEKPSEVDPVKRLLNDD